MFDRAVDHSLCTQLVEYIEKNHKGLEYTAEAGPYRHPQSYKKSVALPDEFNSLSLGILGEKPEIVRLLHDNYSTFVTLANRQEYWTTYKPFVWIVWEIFKKRAVSATVSRIAFPWTETKLSIERDWVLQEPVAKSILSYKLNRFGMLIINSQRYIRTEEGIVDGVAERTSIQVEVNYDPNSTHRGEHAQISFHRRLRTLEGPIPFESLILTLTNHLSFSGSISGKYGYLSQKSDPYTKKKDVLEIVNTIIHDWDKDTNFIYPE